MQKVQPIDNPELKVGTTRKHGVMRKRLIVKNLSLYIMTLPGIIYLFINNYLPLGGLLVAFKDYKYTLGILHSPFVGLQNFSYLFKTSMAMVITRNTLLYNLAFILVNTLGAITISILLNEIVRKKSLKLFQTMILLPYLVSTVVISNIVFAFLSANTGFLNQTILPALGLPPQGWYSEPKFWPFILISVNFWKEFGFLTIIYYASIIGVDPEYYEVAALDGASKWQQIIHITLPSIRSVIIIMVLMAVGRIFYSNFGLFYQVTQDSGMLYSVTNTIDTFVYRALILNGDFGMSSAASLYQSVVGFVLVLASNLIVRKIDPESALF